MKEEREKFEPLATQIISSLRFPSEITGVLTNQDGLPLPPGYTSIPPQDILEDIAEPTQWRAYEGKSGIDGLQAFYTREVRNFGWQILEYIPFPTAADLGFARFKLVKNGQEVMLGILPYKGGEKDGLPGRLAFKMQ